MNDLKNRSRYAKQGLKTSGRPRGCTGINIHELLSRVQSENINLSEFVRVKLQEHFDELDEARYLDFFNNFLTIAKYAEYYGLSVEQATATIGRGRTVNHRRPQKSA